MFNHEIAKRLIDERGLKRRWVADRVGITHASLNQILCARGKPCWETISRLAAVLSVPPEVMWTEGGNKARTA